MYEGILPNTLLFRQNAIRGLGYRGLLMPATESQTPGGRPLPEPGQRGYQRCHWLVGFSWMEEVGHRIHEDKPRPLPLKRLVEPLRSELGDRTLAHKGGRELLESVRQTSRRSNERSPGLTLVQPVQGIRAA